MKALWAMWLIGGLPALAAPLIWFAGLFAVIAEGFTAAQRYHVMACMAYPLVYLLCLIVSIGRARGGDPAAAARVMLVAVAWLAAVVLLWPVHEPG
ncbi:MAG: hypothetical protein ACT4QA_15515 [Panacagrimonas sp.]